MKYFQSQIDESINFVTPCEDGGFFESRYVRREEDYFICYLSSHSGCNKGCSMCWLTATKQLMMTPATEVDMINQAVEVLNHYKKCKQSRLIHYNWMARGEPLDNPNLNGGMLDMLNTLVEGSLIPKFNISTIMPRTLKDTDLASRFAPIYPSIYYSFYSTDEDFRKKWLPGAMPYSDALTILRKYQKDTGQIIRIHGCFIDGENDSLEDVDEMIAELLGHRLSCRLNIVRFNPPEGDPHKESPMERLCEIMHRFEEAGIPTKLIPRVGIDVKASCGMFTTPEEFVD